MVNPEIVTTVVLLLTVLLLIGTPVAFSLGISGGLGLLLLTSTGAANAGMGQIPFSAVAQYSWIIVPLFIFMGVVAAQGRLGEDIYALLTRVLRRVPGGLGLATIGASAGFSAISGSSLATATTIGRISISQMRQHGYPATLATGIVAYAGTLGVLIPPSIILVVYGLLTGESIGQLLVAAIVPGIVTTIALMAYVVILFTIKHVKTEVSDLEVEQKAASYVQSGALKVDARRQIADQVRAAVLIVVIFVIVMGGVYSGFFTVTEAAALGAIVTVIAVPVHLKLHSGKAREGFGRTMWASAKEASSTTSMVFAIVVGASIFTSFLVLARVPSAFADWVLGLGLEPLGVLLLLLAVTIPLGMFLDAYSMMIIVVPLAYPAVVELGYSGILFGILMVKMVEFAFVTPPLGLNCYVVASVSDDIRVEDVFRGVMPFLLVDACVIGILIAFPQLTLWLPSLILG